MCEAGDRSDFHPLGKIQKHPKSAALPWPKPADIVENPRRPSPGGRLRLSPENVRSESTLVMPANERLLRPTHEIGRDRAPNQRLPRHPAREEFVQGIALSA